MITKFEIFEKSKNVAVYLDVPVKIPAFKKKKIKGVEYGKFKGKTYTGKIISHVPGEKIRYI